MAEEDANIIAHPRKNNLKNRVLSAIDNLGEDDQKKAEPQKQVILLKLIAVLMAAQFLVTVIQADAAHAPATPHAHIINH